MNLKESICWDAMTLQGINNTLELFLGYVADSTHDLQPTCAVRGHSSAESPFGTKTEKLQSVLSGEMRDEGVLMY